MNHTPSSRTNTDDGFNGQQRELMLALDALDDARRVGDPERAEAAMRRVVALGGDRALRDDRLLRDELKTRFRPPSPDEDFLRSISGDAKAAHAPAVDVEIRPAGGAAGSLRGRPIRALAAALLLVACAWLAYVQFAPVKVDPGVIYGQIVRAGFTPMEVCTDDAEFRSYTQRQYGIALAFSGATDAVELVGWNYNLQLHTAKTGALLARVKGKPVVVFIETSELAQAIRQPSDPSLKAFRTQLGPLVFDEVTPLDAPFVSRSLTLPPCN